MENIYLYKMITTFSMDQGNSTPNQSKKFCLRYLGEISLDNGKNDCATTNA